MRLLVLQSELGVLQGGGENFTRNLFAAFVKRGHHVKAAFVADRQNRYPLPMPAGIEPVPLSGWWSMNPGQAALSGIARFIPCNSVLRAKWDHLQQAISWRTIRWHNRRFQQRSERAFAGSWEEFDAIYVHANPLLASKVARYRPTVLRLPGPVGAEQAATLRTIHAVCANGDALLLIRKFLGDHVTELPIGIDVDLFKPGPTSIRSALGWSGHHQVIGYAGRLVHLKGVDLLASAFRDTLRNMANARLLLVGSGEEEKYIRPLLAKELARGIVHIEPNVNHHQLAEWYRAMDVFVMPSRYENYSNALLEALSCGIPFVASDVGGNRLFARSGAGWLFESQSVSSLTTCLRDVLTTNQERKIRGEIAAYFAQSRHSWAASAETLEGIMESRLKVEGHNLPIGSRPVSYPKNHLIGQQLGSHNSLSR